MHKCKVVVVLNTTFNMSQQWEKSNIFLTQTEYAAATYEELKTVIAKIVSKNESGLDDDIDSLKTGIAELKPKVEYLIRILMGDEVVGKEKLLSHTNITIGFPNSNVKPVVDRRVSYKGAPEYKDETTLTTPRSSYFMNYKSATTPTNSKQIPRLQSDSTTGNYGMLGSFGPCRNTFGEVILLKCSVI